LEYELKGLEHIITVVLNTQKLNLERLNEEFINEIKQRADIEKEVIKKQFINVVFLSTQESYLELYFHQHQTALVQLADIIFNYLKPKGPESIFRITNDIAIVNLYKYLYECLEALLNFIRKNYTKYFDQDGKMPETYRWAMAKEIKSNLNQIKKELNKMRVDVEFIKIISNPYEKYLFPEIAISYREFSYLKELRGELLHSFGKKDKTNFSEMISNLLLHMNFNSKRFIKYFVTRIEVKAKSYDNIPDQIKYYSLKMKLLNQVPAKHGYIFTNQHLSIRDQVGSWISEELYYLKTCQQLKYQSPSQNYQQEHKETKLHTSLSVAHLSLAVKLLIDARLITNTNLSEVIKMVARNFRTDNAEQISEDSLRNKSYSFETATVNRVKDEVIGLLNLMKRY